MTRLWPPSPFSTWAFLVWAESSFPEPLEQGHPRPLSPQSPAALLEVLPAHSPDILWACDQHQACLPSVTAGGTLRQSACRHCPGHVVGTKPAWGPVVLCRFRKRPRLRGLKHQWAFHDLSRILYARNRGRAGPGGLSSGGAQARCCEEGLGLCRLGDSLCGLSGKRPPYSQHGSVTRRHQFGCDICPRGPGCGEETQTRLPRALHGEPPEGCAGILEEHRLPHSAAMEVSHRGRVRGQACGPGQNK